MFVQGDFFYRFYHGKSPWKSHHLGNISSSLQSPTKKFQVHWTPANCTHEIPRRDTPLGLKIRANYNDQTAEVTLKCGLVKENSPKIRTGYLIFRWSVLDMSLRCTYSNQLQIDVRIHPDVSYRKLAHPLKYVEGLKPRKKMGKNGNNNNSYHHHHHHHYFTTD